MEIKRRTQDLETVFNNRWEANNYNKNGFKEMSEQRKDHFNRLYNIKSKDQQRKEILEANSVNGKVASLEAKMKAASSFNNRNRLG